MLFIIASRRIKPMQLVLCKSGDANFENRLYALHEGLLRRRINGVNIFSPQQGHGVSVLHIRLSKLSGHTAARLLQGLWGVFRTRDSSAFYNNDQNRQMSIWTSMN